MSGFDTAFRTQSMLAPIQMEAGRRQNEGITMIGNAAVGAADQYNQAHQQAAELAMRQAESNAKMVMWQQEQQLNAYKIENLMAMDTVTGSRIQVELQREGLEAARLTNKQTAAQLQAQDPVEDREQKSRLVEKELYSDDPRMFRDPVDDKWRAATTEEQTVRTREIEQRRTGRSTRGRAISGADVGDRSKVLTWATQGLRPEQGDDGEWQLVPSEDPAYQQGAIDEIRRAEEREERKVDNYGTSGAAGAQARYQVEVMKQRFKLLSDKVEIARQRLVGATDTEQAAAQDAYDAAVEELNGALSTLSGESDTAEDELNRGVEGGLKILFGDNWKGSSNAR